MEGAESPLDVLSRAATMVQENQLNSTSDDASKQSSKQLPTAKWKRDRRSRLPEYSRKSDPKSADEPDSPPPNEPNDNAPLDMSVKQRGLPPSYTQTINNPGYRSSYRPSVATSPREELPPGISMVDPIIDEHFRRSLGKDYSALFSNNNKESNPAKVAAPPSNKKPNNVTSSNHLANEKIIELMDTSGLSVDDHFAKALGETWVKLNKKEQELKNTNSENCNNLVTI